jgi:rubrerythrin
MTPKHFFNLHDYVFTSLEMDYKASKRKKQVPIEPLCKKRIYHSSEEAQDMIRHIRENRIAREIRVYRCPVCGFWHLTSKSE